MGSLNQTLGSTQVSSVTVLAVQASLSDANLSRHNSLMAKSQLWKYNVYPLIFAVKTKLKHYDLVMHLY